MKGLKNEWGIWEVNIQECVGRLSLSMIFNIG